MVATRAPDNDLGTLPGLRLEILHSHPGGIAYDWTFPGSRDTNPTSFFQFADIPPISSPRQLDGRIPESGTPLPRIHFLFRDYIHQMPTLVCQRAPRDKAKKKKEMKKMADFTQNTVRQECGPQTCGTHRGYQRV